MAFSGGRAENWLLPRTYSAMTVRADVCGIRIIEKWVGARKSPVAASASTAAVAVIRELSRTARVTITAYGSPLTIRRTTRRGRRLLQRETLVVRLCIGAAEVVLWGLRTTRIKASSGISSTSTAAARLLRMCGVVRISVGILPAVGCSSSSDVVPLE